MSLFDDPPPDSDIGFLNIRSGEQLTAREIREALERLWAIYQPFADTKFKAEFARDPYSRFWEMFLAVALLEEGKILRPRADVPASVRDTGPDICVVEERRKIWIEAVAPGHGASDNPDRIPEIRTLSESGQTQPAPRNEVELRISHALLQKKKRYQSYIRTGLVAAKDLCLVAVSGAKFGPQSWASGFPRAVSTVYPVGERYATFSRSSSEVVESGYTTSWTMRRSSGEEVPRYAFLVPEFRCLSGLIWSRRTIGNFTQGGHGFVFIHNFAADKALPRNWISWEDEYVVEQRGEEAHLRAL